MNTQKYHWIFYLIATTIITTIGVQFYWNYKNYQENKQRVINEITTSLDNAIDDYYTNLSKKNLLTIIEPEKLTSKDSVSKKQIWNEIFKEIETKNNSLNKRNLKTNPSISSIKIRRKKEVDHNKISKKRLLKDFIEKSENNLKPSIDLISKNSNIQVFRGKKAQDSIKLMKGLNTIFIAILNDSLSYNTLDSLLTNKLNNKKIDVKFAFNHYKKDTLYYTYNTSKHINKTDSINSNSTYFKENEHLQLIYTNPMKETLKRSSMGIFLSFLLAIAVISSLFYLLKIINKQKELATIKNDLISNITHEFKTPIATVSTVIEAIENFNVLEDKEKTKKYLSTSSFQLKKLHQMVEKLLETAALDSEQLLLKKEPTNIVEIIEKIVNRHKLVIDKKELIFFTNTNSIHLNVDIFHFENAISNLIDNAIKYGGNKIEVNITSIFNSIEITISDNGKGIEKHLQEKIFDKFYRVPKGNTHDVKGFGIGLYYCKKIIEKHLGSINVSSTQNKTVFKINLPNG